MKHYHRPRTLNGRVRNGNGCGRPGLLTGKVRGYQQVAVEVARSPQGPGEKDRSSAGPESGIGAAKRSAVSTGQLKRLPALHTRPIDLVVFQEPSPREGPETSSRGGFHA